MELNPCLCFYCSRKTAVAYKSLKKSFNSKAFIINNIPMYFCSQCKEFFYPNDVLNTFKKVNWDKLANNSYEFEYLERNTRRD